jgi:RNA polymerase sigma-70 factor, ECF subfamily
MVDGEKHIIESAIRGESEAFGLLYDRYQPQIYRFIYLKVGHREEAEDLTHQVFVNAWQNVEKYEFRSLPFSSWLYRIARNQVVDYYRSYKGNKEQNLETIAELKADHSIELTLDTSLAFKKVQGALTRLNPDYQDILIMRFTEDMSPKEIAAALGKSVGAVKVAQHRALANLKELLNESHGSTI